MQKMILFLLILLSPFRLCAIEIDENSSNLSLLNQASIFIDRTNKLSLEEIKKKKFIANKIVNLNLGYKAEQTLWIKLMLHNKTQKKLNKILEFAYKQTESVTLYTNNKILKGGFLHYNENRNSLKPSFHISLKPNEYKAYYLSVRSKIKPLRATITLWNELDFIHYNLTDKMYRFILLGMIVVLFIYNAMIFMFTKDKAYLYYIFYLFALMLLTNYYSGVISYYLLSPSLAIFAIKLHTTAATIYLVFCILFTQVFLQTKQFKIVDKLLDFSLYLVIIIGIFTYNNWIFNSNAASFLVLIGGLIVYAGFHALYKGVEQAKYYVLGWTLMLISFSLFALQGLGFYSLKDYPLSYLIETTFVIEALLFSMALAHKINIINNEKTLSDAKLLAFQLEEKKHLALLVTEKTNKLEKSLHSQNLLYKELNHRVKNNFMMILSLIKLQISRSKALDTKDALRVTQSRIKSISNFYEMILMNNVDIETEAYLQKIYHNISMGFKYNIEIEYDIEHNIQLNALIHIGLVFNEVINNTFKHAFENKKGKILVKLRKEEENVYLLIKDNGQGFKEKPQNSLGLMIVETLVEGQLEGELNIDSTDGTAISISWKES